MSITSSDFKLPFFFAESVLQSFTESANKPFVISCVDKESYKKEEYVVKLNSSERMSPSAALRETLASLIAVELSIPTPVPGIIDIVKDFIETRKGFDDYQRFVKSQGHNYGNKFLGDNVIQFVPKDFEMYKGNIEGLQEIFIFDMFIENSDRTYNKPNLLLKDRIIYAIDHEIAFGFTFDVLPNKRPWLFDSAIYHLIENHCLHANLKGKKFLANNFFENFSKLNDTFWTKAYALLPDQWKLDDFFKIRDYLCLKIEHITEFKNEIMEVLK